MRTVWPIVHGIVTDHRGRIEVRSSPGRGTRFTIELATCAPADPDRRIADAAPESESGVLHGHGQLILVAEDNELVRPLLVDTLEMCGYDVVYAVDGEEALEQFEQHKSAVSLVVLDLDLPKRSGMECLQLIRADRSDVPVVIISGSVDSRLVDRAITCGAAGCLPKTIPKEAIIEAVDTVLAGGIYRPDDSLLDVAVDDGHASLPSAEIEQRLNAVRSPFRTAEAFLVEEIIDPRDTRPLLCEFANLAAPVRRAGRSAFHLRP